MREAIISKDDYNAGPETLEIGVQNHNGSMALHNAAERNDERELAALLAAGADPSITDKWGYNALHEAARLGHSSIVALLVQHPKIDSFINREASSDNGPPMTPLCCAWFDGSGATAGKVRSVQLLLENGAMVTRPMLHYMQEMSSPHDERNMVVRAWMLARTLPSSPFAPMFERLWRGGKEALISEDYQQIISCHSNKERLLEKKRDSLDAADPLKKFMADFASLLTPHLGEMVIKDKERQRKGYAGIICK